MNPRKRHALLVSACLLLLLLLSVSSVLTDADQVFASDGTYATDNESSSDTLSPVFGEVDNAEGVNYTTTNVLPITIIHNLLL